MNILANDGISASGKAKLEEAGHNVVTEKVEQGRLANAINDNNYEVVLVRSATTIRKDLVDQCPNLKMIGRGGVGMDNIDVEYAREKGIKVFNTPAASSQSVAELVFAHLFGLARNIYEANRQMPSRGRDDFKALKKAYKGIELRGKTLGLFGLGRIGQYTAKYALGLGMKVIAVDPYVPEATIEVEINGELYPVKIKSTSAGEVLSNSDFISLHVPKQEDGSAVITDKEMAKMKDGVYLVNLSRGGVIDEGDLVKNLDSGKVAGAALDVFENEPTPDERLLKHSKMSLSPHIGAATAEAQDRIGLEIADIILSA